MSLGYSVARVRPGGWYAGVFPGGFTDAVTGIHIPGPIVEVDELRRPTKIVSMPAPVQIAHRRTIQRIDDHGKLITEEVAMDYSTDEHPSVLDGLHLALGCGVIREVLDDELKRRYPEAFAQEREDSVYDPTPRSASMAELLDRYYAESAQRSNELAADAEAARREADAALNGKSR